MTTSPRPVTKEVWVVWISYHGTLSGAWLQNSESEALESAKHAAEYPGLKVFAIAKHTITQGEGIGDARDEKVTK